MPTAETTQWEKKNNEDGTQFFNSDGSIEMEEITLTKVELQNERTKRRRGIYLMSYSVFGIASLVSFVVALFSVPVFVLVFGCDSGRSGGATAAIYVLGLCAIVLMLISLFVPGASRSGEVFLVGILLYGCYGVALIIPLVTSKEIGFRMTSPNRERFAK